MVIKLPELLDSCIVDPRLVGLHQLHDGKILWRQRLLVMFFFFKHFQGSAIGFSLGLQPPVQLYRIDVIQVVVEPFTELLKVQQLPLFQKFLYIFINLVRCLGTGQGSRIGTKPAGKPVTHGFKPAFNLPLIPWFIGTAPVVIRNAYRMVKSVDDLIKSRIPLLPFHTGHFLSSEVLSIINVQNLRHASWCTIQDP